MRVRVIHSRSLLSPSDILGSLGDPTNQRWAGIGSKRRKKKRGEGKEKESGELPSFGWFAIRSQGGDRETGGGKRWGNEKRREYIIQCR